MAKVKQVPGRAELFLKSCRNTFAILLKAKLDKLDKALIEGRLLLMYDVGFDDGVSEEQRRVRVESYKKEDYKRKAKAKEAR